jgi:hypothetical protein
MGKYYLFDRNSDPGRWIDDDEGDEDNNPEVDWYYWRKGAFIPKTEIIPNPILFSLKRMSQWASDHGPHIPSFLEAAAPLFSDALIQALNDCGVDNLETYPVAIRDPDNGEVYTNYKAVNVIGLVSAADMRKSNVTVHSNNSQDKNSPIIDADFDGLVIDQKRTHDLLLFRLAESANGILVHESVCDYLLKKGFTDLAFYETKNVAL